MSVAEPPKPARARAQRSRIEKPIPIECTRCGSTWDASARYARNIRRGDWPRVCPACNHPARGDIKVTPALKRWWLQRYTPDEVHALARELVLFWEWMHALDDVARGA